MGAGKSAMLSTAPEGVPLGGSSPFFSVPPSTVTKLGQKPLRQEKSLLHADWSIFRLRPNSVSTGTTERQFDCTEQSPQPSQTSR